jgi:hypothetical protein
MISIQGAVMKINNEKGISLVNVLIAIGLTGVLSVILMKLSEQQAQIQKKAVTDNEINEVVTLFRGMISKKDSCNATIQGLKLGNTFDEFRFDYDRNKPPFAEVSNEDDSTKAAKFSNTRIIVREMKILSKQEVEDLKDSNITYSPSTVVLRVKLEKPGNNLGGKHTTKYFQIPASIGHGEWFLESTKEQIETGCSSLGGKIANIETGEDGDSDDIVAISSGYIGYCKIQDSNDDLVLGCL